MGLGREVRWMGLRREVIGGVIEWEVAMELKG